MVHVNSRQEVGVEISKSLLLWVGLWNDSDDHSEDCLFSLFYTGDLSPFIDKSQAN